MHLRSLIDCIRTGADCRADQHFLAGPLPACDVVLLANVLTTLSADDSRALLRRIYEHLPANGVVLLSGWMLDADRTGPIIPVLFCLEDIDWGAPDMERPAATYAAWLAEIGFEASERVTYFEPASLLVGRKPGASSA